MPKKQKRNENGEIKRPDYWTPERIAEVKADPKLNDPKNWAVNPQLDPEDEAILDRIDAERVREAEIERAVEEAIKRKPGETVKKKPYDSEDPDARFVSEDSDGGMILRDGKTGKIKDAGPDVPIDDDEEKEDD